MRDQPEFRLQCAVADHLRLAALPNVYWTAMPFGEMRDRATKVVRGQVVTYSPAGERLKRMGVRAGAGDILLMIDHRGYMLELKAAKGVQNEAQKFTQADWEAAGGIYEVAVGVDAALDALRRWGAIPESYRPVRALQLDMFYKPRKAKAKVAA